MFKFATLALLGLASAWETSMSTSLGAGAKDAAAKAANNKLAKDLAAYTAWQKLKTATNTANTALAAEKAKTAKLTKAQTKANTDKVKKLAAAHKTLATANAAKPVVPADVKAAKAAITAEETKCKCKADYDKLAAADTAVKANTAAIKKLAKAHKAAKKLSDAAGTKAKNKKPIGKKLATGIASVRTLITTEKKLFNAPSSVYNSKVATFTKDVKSIAVEEAFWKAAETERAAAKKLKANEGLKKGIAALSKAAKDMKAALTAQSKIVAKKVAKDITAGKAAYDTAKAAYIASSSKGAILVAKNLAATAAKGDKAKYTKYATDMDTAAKANAASTGGGLTWLWVVLGLAIAGAGGFFLYTKFKKND